MTSQQKQERAGLRALMRRGWVTVEQVNDLDGERMALVTIASGVLLRESRWVPAEWVEGARKA